MWEITWLAEQWLITEERPASCTYVINVTSIDVELRVCER